VELEICESERLDPLSTKESRLSLERDYLGRTQEQVVWQEMSNISLLIPC